MTEFIMTGGEAAVAALKVNGISKIYALPGIQLDHLFNALHGATDWLEVINARHEQGVAYMALGHAQSTGTPGIYACVPGPGFLNTTAALSTAYAVHAPVLAIIGQINTDAIGVGGGELHELRDQTAIIKGLTRWNAIARSPEEVGPLLETAFAKLAAGIAPVAVELPADVLKNSSLMPLPKAAAPEPKTTPDSEAVANAAAMLSEAKRPFIVVGSGAYGGEAELRTLAEALSAPVMMHLQGRGVLASEHPLAIGMGEGKTLWADADVVLAVGTRFHRFPTEWPSNIEKRVIRVDVDPKRFSIGAPPELAVAADGPTTLSALASALVPTSDNADWMSTVAAVKADLAARLASEIAPQMAYLAAMRSALPDNAHIVADYTQIGYVSADRYPVSAPRLMITPGYQGTLGYAYATALGVKSANPDRTVVALCGDGGFMFTANEMATAVRHNISAIGVVFVDGAFGNVQRMQRELHGGKVIATDLTNPDFAAFARSFGAKAIEVDSPEDFSEALQWAQTVDGPSLIVVKVTRFPDPWDMIEP